MSILGPSLAQSLAGSAQAERAAVREQAKPVVRDPKRVRGQDQLDLEPERVESAEAVRSPKGNDQEETREDRREHASYQPGGLTPTDEPGARIDVEG